MEKNMNILLQNIWVSLYFAIRDQSLIENGSAETFLRMKGETLDSKTLLKM